MLPFIDFRLCYLTRMTRAKGFQTQLEHGMTTASASAASEALWHRSARNATARWEKFCLIQWRIQSGRNDGIEHVRSRLSRIIWVRNLNLRLLAALRSANAAPVHDVCVQRFSIWQSITSFIVNYSLLTELGLVERRRGKKHGKKRKGNGRRESRDWSRSAVDIRSARDTQS